MALPMHQRYEIVFLSQHPLGPKLGHKSVAKVVKCTTSTVQYWLSRWKQPKDLDDSARTGRPRATTPKQDKQILSFVEQQTFVTSRDITNQLNRKRVKINERTVRRRLNEGGGRCNRPLLKPLLTENHRINRLKWAHDYKAMDWNQVIFTDETTVRLNCVKGMVWNLPEKKRSCEPSSIQLKSMFGVASQVKDSVGSSVLRKT